MLNGLIDNMWSNTHPVRRTGGHPSREGTYSGSEFTYVVENRKKARSSHPILLSWHMADSLPLVFLIISSGIFKST